mmetsp:Transcript_40280/g.110862  ORF Transcript_40280/g.110862 Transcript_40280/m.110862 type:complete len:220 (-) Transcript_40280:3-662(-)
MRIDRAEFTATLPSNNVQSSWFPFSRSGSIFAAHFANSSLSPFWTIWRPMRSRPIRPSVSPEKRPDNMTRKPTMGRVIHIGNPTLSVSSSSSTGHSQSSSGTSASNAVAELDELVSRRRGCKDTSAGKNADARGGNVIQLGTSSKSRNSFGLPSASRGLPQNSRHVTKCFASSLWPPRNMRKHRCNGPRKFARDGSWDNGKRKKGGCGTRLAACWTKMA